jgi:electron transport complex protein RnfE
MDGLGMGLGFTLALVVIGSIREILGAGKWLGMNVTPQAYMDSPMLVAILAPGAFIIMGLLMGLINILNKGK